MEPKIIKKTFVHKHNEFDDEFSETRYIIVDDNGKIIDDAQGYGYKTYQNAYKSYYYKKNKPKIDKLRKEANKIIDIDEKQFKDAFNYCAEEEFITVCKDREDFDFYKYFWNYIEKYCYDLYSHVPEDHKIRKAIIRELNNR